MSEEIKCPVCGKDFDDMQKMFVHKMNFAPEANEICNICREPVPSCTSMQEHLDGHFLCSICQMRFASEEKLAIHKITKHAESVPNKLYSFNCRRYPICFVCGMMFKDAALADIHMKVFHLVLRVINDKTRK